MSLAKTSNGRLDDATVERIRLHYKRLGLDRGWTRDRFHRLCLLLNCTPRELAALCCIPSVNLTQWTKDNKFPPYAVLHFALIESAYLQATCGLEREPVMPVNMLHD
jgi:hypothetical protein